MGDVLESLAAGSSEAKLLEDFPQLCHEDVLACLAFAAEREGGWWCLLSNAITASCLLSHTDAITDFVDHPETGFLLLLPSQP